MVIRIIEAEAGGFDNIANKRYNYKYFMRTYRQRIKSIKAKCKK